MAVGGWFEIIAYAARASAHNKTGKLMPYAIQNSGTLLAPALFAASIYMTLGRIISSVRGWSYSIVPVTWLTKTFVLGDILSFAIQGGAAGLMVTGNNAKLGEDIVVLGLVVQIVMFGLFAVTAWIFHRRMMRAPTPQSGDPRVKWEQNLLMLYLVSGLIMIRSIFRVIEFALGADGYPLNNEWTLYIFDSLLMFFVMVVFYWRWPSDIGGKMGFDKMSEDATMIGLSR
ncbi:RTA1 like protein [Hypoxylon crocopeplum]|nr:RTA1 like protein [Hypoxylon crocopeplum]